MSNVNHVHNKKKKEELFVKFGTLSFVYYYESASCCVSRTTCAMNLDKTCSKPHEMDWMKAPCDDFCFPASDSSSSSSIHAQRGVVVVVVWLEVVLGN